MLTTAGLQVPGIPFNDVVGKTGTVSPEQIVSVGPKLKVVIVFGSTVTVRVAGVAHCPAVGVNV